MPRYNVVLKFIEYDIEASSEDELLEYLSEAVWNNLWYEEVEEIYEEQEDTRNAN